MKIIPVIPNLFWNPDSEQSTVTKTLSVFRVLTLDALCGVSLKLTTSKVHIMGISMKKNMRIVIPLSPTV
jgi:hypothetical protein|tara:strand:- start:438 stop:647 length:210 start_codon:yes stop_codon:yes gene_type:complete